MPAALANMPKSRAPSFLLQKKATKNYADGILVFSADGSSTLHSLVSSLPRYRNVERKTTPAST